MTNPDPAFWKNRRVLLTGHTGFKGAWLALWLQELGAEVTGFALPEPPTRPSMYEVARVGEGMRSIAGDVRDPSSLSSAVAAARPEVVVHMAAQSLVLRSYRDPVDTYGTNVMGTVNLLEAVRAHDGVRAAVVVTSDKCYENRETHRAYAEADPMGGRDPYSSSKGCAELVTTAYRNSFFGSSDAPAVASARAGNVVGGGDFSEDRLVPDLMRAFLERRAARVRRPDAVRPWQHVLEPLRGYLLLCERLVHEGAAFAEGWNFGPSDEDTVQVRTVVERLLRYWPGSSVELAADVGGPHEAGLLRLDCSKARLRLGWEPRWDLDRCLKETAAWFKAMQSGDDLRSLSLGQLRDYTGAGGRS
jgi:CDP-glucose 4,6-dehydratase